ncbi:hypothetical protein DFS34DRAFT_583406 [Phlyctochytrium arcticum]|nr:hypothetical protein DFS34DRAFT_583406 [Phlyctochytrium arcticum]
MAPLSRFFLASSAVLAATTSVFGQALTDILEFDPPILTIPDVDVATVFKARLKNIPPNDKATVVFDTPGLTSTNCSVDYDLSNWNIFRPIHVFPINQYTQEGTVDLTITGEMRCNGCAFEKRKQTYGCKRALKKAVQCTSLGDPHFKTFGGTLYDFHSIGTFYMVQSPRLTVETLQFQCGAGACNSGVAVRYGSSVVVIRTESDITLSNGAMELKQASPTLAGLAITSSADKHNYKIKIVEDGSEIEIVSNKFLTFNYLDVTVRVGGPYFQNVGGLCNTYQDGVDTGLIMPDGKKATTAKIFGDSWKVKDDDNIFECGDKCKGAGNQGQNPGVKCTIPVDVPAPPPQQTLVTTVITTTPAPTPAPTTPAGTTDAPATPPTALPSATPTTIVKYSTVITQIVTVTGTSSVTAIPKSTTIPKPPPRPVNCPESFYNEATAYCNKLMDVPGCADKVNLDFYKNACIKDTIFTGSFIFAESMKEKLLANCRAVTDGQKDAVDPVEQKKGSDAQTQIGFGAACGDGCGANGQCSPLGCLCNPGFVGKNCETDMAQLPTYNTTPVQNDKGVTIDISKPDYEPRPVPPKTDAPNTGNNTGNNGNAETTKPTTGTQPTDNKTGGGIVISASAKLVGGSAALAAIPAIAALLI